MCLDALSFWKDDAPCAWQVEKLCCVSYVQARTCATWYIPQVASLGKLWDSRETKLTVRGIEWSLRAFASMRALRLFLRARAGINFCEQRALRKFFASWNLSLLRRCFAPSNVADTFKTELRPASFKRQQNRMHFSRMLRTITEF